MIIEVLVELSSRNIDKTFDYKVPKILEKDIEIGKRVLVPFGYQKLEGFILKVKEKSEVDNDLKEIISVVDEEAILNEELLALGKNISDSTLSTLISSYQVMLPKALKAKSKVNINKKIDSYICLNNNVNIKDKMNSSQMEIINFLKDNTKVLKTTLNKISSSSVKTLLRKNIIIEIQEENYRLKHEKNQEDKKKLTPMQQKVVTEVLSSSKQSEVFLLHGVTGSGKTEVYMELIEEKLKEGKESIVLVPEISLTQQMILRFEKRFSDNIAILHSKLSDGEKYDEWRRIARGEVKIVIGARSAIFAPLKNLGIIIIDEEHTTSYKQENNPKYSAIEVAKWRANYNKISVILGSATPTLESYARARKNVYHLLELSERVNKKPLPKVELIDMNTEMKTCKGHFSSPLMKNMLERINNKEQIILLLNRRGYSSFVSCKECGYTEKCPNCDISLTYHKSSNVLRCHYCGYATNKKEICPNCGSKALSTLGIGTEKIEEELNKYLPAARVIRMDFDTTSKKGSHQKIIKAFQNQEYDILLGTQMIAKGLDFSNVTLVGVINADTSLNIPDFRSSEYTFQLLSQVAGRSGRGDKEGKVIFQTYNKDHYAISLAATHNYISFYEQEMKIRRELKYPPYYYLTVIKILSKDYTEARNESTKIAEFLTNNLKNTTLLGPSIASVFKVNNVYHFQIILKYKQEPCLMSTLKKLLEHYKSNSKVKIDIEFNPNHI